MSLRELTAFVVVFQACVVAVVLAGGLDSLVGGGLVRPGTLDVPTSAAPWPEFLLLLLLMAVTPYALYVVDRHLKAR